MRAFRAGDRVRLVEGWHKGGTATILSVDPLRASDWAFWHTIGIPLGAPMYELDIESHFCPGANTWAPGSWLRRFRDGDEPAEHVEEWIRDLLKKTEDA